METFGRSLQQCCFFIFHQSAAFKDPPVVCCEKPGSCFFQQAAKGFCILRPQTIANGYGQAFAPKVSILS